jgi:hypothetical protein
MKTAAYFNVTLENLAQDTVNVSVRITVRDELNTVVGSDNLSTVIASSTSTYYIMTVYLPKWAFVGYATAQASVWENGIPSTSANTSLFIAPEDLTPPAVHILSPTNTTYVTEPIRLVFKTNERTTWTGYILNNRENTTVSGNTTLPSLANGQYSIRVYANDTSGNMGSSGENCFTVAIVHDIAVIDAECSSDPAYKGRIVNITAQVKNEGTVAETFNITAYANSTIIETQNVPTLPTGNQTTVVFTWNTTGLDYGNHTVEIHVLAVTGETDTNDNTLSGGKVGVTIAGDVNGNYVVDMLDLYNIVSRYGANLGQPNYSVRCDVDDSDTISIVNLHIAAQFGRADSQAASFSVDPWTKNMNGLAHLAADRWFCSNGV